MSGTALAIRHVTFQDLGQLTPVLKMKGLSIRYCDALSKNDALPSPYIDDLVVVLGGPFSARSSSALHPRLQLETDFLRCRLDAELPTLGICLGAQLMSRALGGEVHAAGTAEIGWRELNLTPEGRKGPTRHLSGCQLLHWHSDTFELPVGARLLASTPLCKNHVYSVGKFALAFQSHPEVDASRGIDDWLELHAGELLGSGPSPETLQTQTKSLGPDAGYGIQAMLLEWLNSFDFSQPLQEH